MKYYLNNIKSCYLLIFGQLYSFKTFVIVRPTIWHYILMAQQTNKNYISTVLD